MEEFEEITDEEIDALFDARSTMYDFLDRFKNTFMKWRLIPISLLAVGFLGLAGFFATKTGILALISMGLFGSLSIVTTVHATSIALKKYLDQKHHREYFENLKVEKENEKEEENLEQESDKEIGVAEKESEEEITVEKEEVSDEKMEDSSKKGIWKKIKKGFSKLAEKTKYFFYEALNENNVTDDFLDMDDLEMLEEQENQENDVDEEKQSNEQKKGSSWQTQETKQFLEEMPVANFRLYQDHDTSVQSVDLSMLYVEPGLHIVPQHFIVNPKDLETQKYLENRIESITGCKAMSTNRIIDGEEKKIYILMR